MRIRSAASATAGDERQLLLLRAANAASRLEPETLSAEDIAGALAELRLVLEALGRAFTASADDALAAMARWEIGRVRKEIDALAGEAGSSMQRIGALRQHALGMLLGLDRALAAQGREPLLEAIAERERRRAVAVRAALVAFRDEVRALGEPLRGEVRAHLERVRVALRRLYEARGLRRLRVGDRAQVESLLTRIDAALAGGGGEAMSVWRDVAAYAELVLEVNQRADLREHDAALARTLATVLAARPVALASFSFRRRLLCLRGRDPALDALLSGGGDAAAIRARLEAIAEELER